MPIVLPVMPTFQIANADANASILETACEFCELPLTIVQNRQLVNILTLPPFPPPRLIIADEACSPFLHRNGERGLGDTDPCHRVGYLLLFAASISCRTVWYRMSARSCPSV